MIFSGDNSTADMKNVLPSGVAAEKLVTEVSDVCNLFSNTTTKKSQKYKNKLTNADLDKIEGQ